MDVSKNKERIILVTGATGRQGGAVCRHLQNKGFKVRALVRDPNGSQARQLMGHGEEVFQGNLDDPDSLMRAMDGVYGVFSVQPFSANEVQQGVAVIEAAKRQGVSHFVYSSVGAADEETGIPHFETKIEVEKHLQSSGLAYTVVRPVFFMENWHRGFGASIRSGQLQQPFSPAETMQMIAVDDIGAFVVLAFEHPDKWKDRTISLAGDELSMQQIAVAFSRATAQEVKYVQVSWDQFEKNMGRELTVMYHWFEEKGYHFNVDQVRGEYALTHTFDRWLEAYWNPTAANQQSLAITALDGREDAKAFKVLNEEWITRLFTLEAEDRRILDDPQAEIIDRGGRVLLARMEGRTVGCVALVLGSPGVFELGKMSVAPELRNQGIGRKIMAAAIDEARRIGAQSIFLGSSARLPAAVHLYESLGFTHVTREELGPLPYARADTFMQLLL